MLKQENDDIVNEVKEIIFEEKAKVSLTLLILKEAKIKADLEYANKQKLANFKR